MLACPRSSASDRLGGWLASFSRLVFFAECTVNAGLSAFSRLSPTQFAPFMESIETLMKFIETLMESARRLALNQCFFFLLSVRRRRWLVRMPPFGGATARA